MQTSTEMSGRLPYLVGSQVTGLSEIPCRVSTRKPVPADNGEALAGAAQGRSDDGRVIPWEVREAARGPRND